VSRDVSIACEQQIHGEAGSALKTGCSAAVEHLSLRIFAIQLEKTLINLI